MADALQLIRKNQEKHARGEDATLLDLGNCGLTELPDALFDCVWLEELILSREWWEWDIERKMMIPFESQNEGEENALSELDTRFAGFLRLKKLFAGAWGKRWGIVSLEPLAKLKNLTALNFRSNQIESLEPLANLTNLFALNVRSNRITSLEPLANLANLSILNVRSNLITSLEPLKNLRNLTLLNVRSNKIENLEPIKNLTNLASLDMSSNSIQSLEPLEKLSNLTTLDVNSNQITSLEPLNNLTHLSILYVNSNQITSLEPLKNSSNLATLDVSSNQITSLEPVLAQIKKGLNVEWYNFPLNPWQHPPAVIIQQGREAILNYFSELKKAGEEEGLEAKVILIGEGQSGKTSLRTRLLRGEQAPLPMKKDRTYGLEVEIEPLMVDLRNGKRMRLNIFDFGGQAHYKPLHQFFYSHRSLYVLVTRNGDDSNEFDFWFDTAQLFGGGSPVLVVNNLFGDVRSGFNRSRYARFDAIIKDSLDVNLLTSEGFSAVRKRIEQLAEDLPLVHQTIPKTWANVRREIENLRHRNIIDLKEYLAICAKPENDAMDSERAMHCLAYLNDIGVCLHYQNFPSLRRYIIVKNEWATIAVYRVMDDVEVNKAHGHFSMDDLERIWKPTREDIERGEDFRFGDYQMELLELMRKFKLCYPLLKNADEFVAPHLLPAKREGDLKWLPDNDLQFEVEYDFMPPGLFSRFIVSRYEDIAGENRDLVWRDEAFFQWKNAKANVSLPSRAGKKAIVFKVQGLDPEERKLLLASFIYDLEKLHAETPGIVVEERIPCICEKCRSLVESNQAPHFYPYSQLKIRKANNKKTIECIHPPFHEVEVDMLLGNIFSIQKSTDVLPAPDKARIGELLTEDVEKALELLKPYDHDFYVMQKARISNIRQDVGQGRESQEEERKIRQQIVKAVLDWLKEAW